MKENENISLPKNLYTNVHNTVIHNSPKPEQPKYPSTGEWIDKIWYIYTMEYYSIIKKE